MTNDLTIVVLKLKTNIESSDAQGSAVKESTCYPPPLSVLRHVALQELMTWQKSNLIPTTADLSFNSRSCFRKCVFISSSISHELVIVNDSRLSQINEVSNTKTNYFKHKKCSVNIFRFY